MFNLELTDIKDVDIRDIFCKDGLYTKYHFDNDDMEQLEKILEVITEQMKFDFYCINCNEERLFESKENSKIKLDVELYPESLMYVNKNSATKNYIKEVLFDNRNFFRDFYCSYCEEDKVIFHFRIENNYLMKVGQFPSLADLTREDTKKYKGILEREDYSDLNRAIGLNSHGVGAGSLIYLRRIFENLIKKAYDESVKEEKWNKDLDFYRIKMEDKIKNLENYLPRFVSEHHFIYGILSKGIHELSEQECRDYFDILRESIFIILDEEIKRVEEKRRIDNASKALSKINSMLGDKK